MRVRPVLVVAALVTASVAGAGGGRKSVAAAAGAAPAGTRVAVVIGNDGGHADDARLRYAESDAQRIADLLTTVGEIATRDVVLLRGRSADEIRGAIRQAEARLLAAGGEGLLLVYYSGHADAEALHPGPTSLPMRDLQSLLRDSAVSTRVLIIDACRSGTLTSLKGGQPGGPFALSGAVEPNPHGLAIVTSSSAGEDSQESEQLKASFFTHHLASGLVGAADADSDGAVTLAEAFAYAARHTTGSTASTWAGPQHPTYRLDLGGRGDLVLTRPRAAALAGGGLGHLAFGEPGSYFIRREGETGLTAEISSDAVERPLALPAGRYEVIQRGSDHLLTGTFTVASSASTAVVPAQMRRVDFGRAVRKGATARVRAVGVYADGGLRGSLLDLGPAAGAGVGARLDLHGLSLTAAFGAGMGSAESTRGTRLSTREFGLRAGVFRAFDLSAVTVAAGLELGLHRLAQSASEQPLDRVSYAASGAPAAIVEIPLRTRFFVWLEAALPAYLMNVETDDRSGSVRAFRVTYRVGAAVGAYL